MTYSLDSASLPITLRTCERVLSIELLVLVLDPLTTNANCRRRMFRLVDAGWVEPVLAFFALDDVVIVKIGIADAVAGSATSVLGRRIRRSRGWLTVTERQQWLWM